MGWWINVFRAVWLETKLIWLKWTLKLFILNKLHRVQPSPRTDTSSVNKFPAFSKFHCRVHKSRPLVPLLSQINPAITIPTSFFKVYINIIFPSAFGFSKLSVSPVCSPHPKTPDISYSHIWYEPPMTFSSILSI